MTLASVCVVLIFLAATRPGECTGPGATAPGAANAATSGRGVQDGAGSAADQPHIVLFIGDDVGSYNMRYRGNLEMHTPNIDQLATVEGLQLERCVWLGVRSWHEPLAEYCHDCCEAAVYSLL